MCARWDLYFGSRETPVATAIAKSPRRFHVACSGGFRMTEGEGAVWGRGIPQLYLLRLPRMVVMGVVHEKLLDVRAADDS